MSRSNKTWSPSKENLLMKHLATLARSSSHEDMFGSQCSINLDNKYLDLPTEPKRRRLTADDTPSSMGSQVSSQVSSRSHSPSLSMSESSLFDDSAVSTPSASPSATLKEHFRKKYRKDELWAAIETNYKYLMDKGIIEACQTTESEGEETTLSSNVSFGEFLKQYKELSDWLKNIQIATQQKKTSPLALAEKYLNQSYHDEIQRSPRLKAFNDYAWQLKQRQPILKDEINVFLKEVNTQWEAVHAATAPTYHDPDSILRDLQDDLECLRKYLDGIEDDLRGQTMRAWSFEELEGVLREHKELQQDIESHSRVVSAILKLSERLQKDNDSFDTDSLEREHQRDSVELSALNLERRWHGIWLQSLEWQCRLEDAISHQKGIYNPGSFLDPSHFSGHRDYTDSDTEYDPQDVASSGDDSFQGLGYRADFIQSPPKSDSSTSFSPDCDSRSTGKDSAIVSETEVRTSSDMSEAYQDLSVSSTGSDSDREYLRMIKMRKRDSRDIGYGSESASDELDSRYRPGITFSGINGRARNVAKTGDFYTTVMVDKIDTESTDKTDGGNNAEPTTCEDSDLGTQLQAVFTQEESEKEDIRYLIDQADIMVQQGNTFNKSISGQGHSIAIGVGSESKSQIVDDGSPKSSSSSGPVPAMIDKGVGTIESSCDASDEESGDSDGPGEEVSMVTDDGADTFDSVVGSEYTSDEMRYASKDYTRLPKLYDTTSLKRRVKGRGKERPWSVIELADVMETKPLSTSESAIDKLAGTYSDSDIPSKSPSVSQSASPTLSRHRIRRPQCMSRSKSESFSLRSQLGAKRKLDLTLPLSHVPPIAVSTKSETTNVEEETVHNNNAGSMAPIRSITVNKYDIVTSGPATPVAGTSGNTTIVPLDVFCTSDEETSSGMPKGTELIHTLQNARFKSSGSSYEDSDTQAGGVLSEPDDVNNGNASSYSESAWDNYQAPLYPSCGEGAQEEALHWEPGEMEFDDEFSLPQSTIIATLIARRSEDETHSGIRPKLVPSNKGNYDDSDSDIEDLHHVLAESRMQLKIADRSLRKKRKDPLATGLYLNPGKYGELLATIDTNIKCLEAIDQHLDPANVTADDIQTIQDLLYQWEKLQALASERRNQSQELKTMYATMLSVQGNLLDGVPELEKSRFKSMEDLVATIANIQGTQKLLQNQQQMVKHLHVAIDTFSSKNPSVNVEGVIKQLHDTDSKLACLQQNCASRLGELEHIAEVWQEYRGHRQELEWLLKEERELLERLAFSQEVDMDVYRGNMEADLKKLVSSLAVYEEKLVLLQQLRAELIEVSDEDVQIDLTAGIADIRNQLFVAQQQCREMVVTNDLEWSAEGHEEDMEIGDEIVPPVKTVATATILPMKLEEPKSTLVRKPRSSPKPKPKRSLVPDWLKSFPIQAIALAVFLGLIYLAAPESLQRLINFTLRFSPELKYVNGAPPV